jgi:NAD(P)-dependent dehydrogenase (short-subunit alcohol dehydrogenase family)
MAMSQTMTQQSDDGPPRVALVTGAGRPTGLGFEVCRQLAQAGFEVVLTARDAAATAARATELRAEGLRVRALRLDVTDPVSVGEARRALDRLDVLVNNAAGMPSRGEQASVHFAEGRAALDTTLIGAWRTTSAFLALLRESGRGRIVNVSSGAGSYGDVAFGLRSGNPMGPAYAVAKAALNAWTILLARELEGTGILVNAVCPGFTATFPGATEMGARPVRDGAASITWAALLPDGGPTGGLFRDGAPLSW